jgi:NAD(P)-dependent dehydrogenase (short-subunit alcohol dehydrogenase family)
VTADDPAPLVDGQVAVVTGGGAGIGAATARLLARHGATVVIADLDEAKAADVAASITLDGRLADATTVDVRESDQVAALRDHVLDRHGRVDVLVNNVGHWVRVVDFVDSDPALWDAIYRVNLLHVIEVTHAFLPSMLAAGRGSIVNVSSIEGLRGYPPDPVYAACKAGVVQFTRSLAVQVGNRGVRVNGVAPDVTDSEQVPYDRLVPPDQRAKWPDWVPVGRRGEPDDQAAVILFLASDLSRFVTGHTLPVDGGTGAAGGWFRSSRAGGWTNRPLDP